MGTEINFAIDLARQTGQMLLDQFWRGGFKTQRKADSSLVTEADVAADRQISQSILEKYPQDLLLSEELQPKYTGLTQTTQDGARSATWIVDPLDGTTNFSMGLHFWGVLIARVIDEFPDLGVLYFPVVDEMYTAQRGMGAFLNGQPLRTQPPEAGKPTAFFTCCSRTYRRYQVDVPYKTRILGSAAYSLCSVARGTAVLGFEATPKIWDIAAAWVLVEEAGGTIQTLNGVPPFPLNPKIDYVRQSFPTMAAANRELAAQGRQQIRAKP